MGCQQTRAQLYTYTPAVSTLCSRTQDLQSTDTRRPSIRPCVYSLHTVQLNVKKRHKLPRQDADSPLAALL